MAQTAFATPLIVNAIVGRAAGHRPVHSPAAFYFDLLLLLVCGTGMLVTWLMGRKYS
jgi:hypothetical protein